MQLGGFARGAAFGLFSSGAVVRACELFTGEARLPHRTRRWQPRSPTRSNCRRGDFVEDAPRVSVSP